MGKVRTNEENFERMLHAPIPGLIGRMAVPTIVSMMITSVYNMADTFFVSQIGTSASGAVGIVFSLMAMIQAIGFTLGTGSGSLVSRLLGQEEEEKAERTASTGVAVAFVLGLLLAVFGLIFIDPLIRLLGATETIFPYAKDYTHYILIGAPYMACAFVLNNILRSQGKAFYSMIGIGAGAVLNIGLDPLFIFGFHLGIGGAALATILSQLVSFFLLFLFCRGWKAGGLKIRASRITLSGRLIGNIIKTGLPSFYRQGLSSAATMLMNIAAGPFGDAAIAAMSIVTRVIQFIVSAMWGFGQGFQPVCGFNYGAKRYDRVCEAFFFCAKVATAGLLVLGIIGFVFAPQIMMVFRRTDQEVIRIGTWALRAQCLMLPLQGFIVMSNMSFQTMGKTLKAAILALARQGLFFIPLVLILPRLFDITGIQLCQPVSDFLTFVIAVPLSISMLREMGALKPKEIQTKEAKAD